MSQPIEYSTAVPLSAVLSWSSQPISSWLAPAVSEVTSSRPRHAAGIWPIASSRVRIRSAGLLAAALPGRSSRLPSSPVLSIQAPTGMCPKPPL
jgi:hypothetical protein